MRQRKRGNQILLLLLIASLGFQSCVYMRLKKAKDALKLSDVPQASMLAKAGISDSVKIHYLGCGGFMIEYSGETILIDPYFTNISMPKIVTSDYKSDTALINQFFLKKTGQVFDENGKIENILLSHAHHDHLADIPALLKNNLKSDEIHIYGSRTVVNTLRSFPNLVADTAKQYHNLEQDFKKITNTEGYHYESKMSNFIYSTKRTIRFAAIPTEHAGHFYFFKGQKLPFTSGHINQPLKSPPHRIPQYKEGENFNYIIDLLGADDTVVYRIVSNAGSASDEGVGFPPESVIKSRNVDLLLLCGANYNIAKNYPEPLIDYLKPQNLFLAHWENFFRPIPTLQRKPEIVPNTNIRRLMKKLVSFSKKRGYPKFIFIEKPLEKPVVFSIK
jgi:L-ascorbate metabolism protein UlaG (beta-lactamase superfamily)